MVSAAERRGVLGGLCYGLSSRAAGGVRGVLLWPQQQSGGYTQTMEKENFFLPPNISFGTLVEARSKRMPSLHPE